jgi:2-polyprenyl-3-methyl-5-hydroxy-6-metoxy-1,4-benzoquinol methylase
MNQFQYAGKELELFAHAVNWKAYLRAAMGPFITGDVLEVGAGIGATMRALRHGRERSWTCLEPDPAMAAELRRQTSAETEQTTVVAGTLADLAPDARFDTILYVDVLEHIEDDAGEVRRAAERLRAGGHLLVMSPAHQVLYSPFDREIGHFRRYNAAGLRALTPAGTPLVSLRYLDATGLLLSAANRLLLRSRMPTLAQVLTWDRRFVPISRRLDPLLGHAVGKSILAVWRRT